MILEEGSMANKSGVAPQVLALPQGGGALQGIGETFAADLFTGTGRLRVPITLPPGRNSVQPTLHLAYSAGQGNGPFGMGWDLSLPSVSRKTSKGIPRYHDDLAAAQPDTFLLAGAEDLVPVAEPGGGITRYRPRTEGLFARVEHHHGPGYNHWTVRSKNGWLSTYGASHALAHDAPVIADPDARSHISAWLLSETEDAFGNRMLYDYDRDSDVAHLRSPELPPPPEGDVRAHHWDQLYVRRIRYVDYERHGTPQYLVTVTFFYALRPDPFSTYRTGFEIRTRLRCHRIEVHTHAETDTLSRAYDLVYLDQRHDLAHVDQRLPLNAVSLLSQISVTGYDNDAVEELPPLEFGYTQFAPRRAQVQVLQAVGPHGEEGPEPMPQMLLSSVDCDLIDLFGNGLPDLMHFDGDVRYWRNVGRGRFARSAPVETRPAGAHLRHPGVLFADLDGDGRAELLVQPHNRYYRFTVHPVTASGGWKGEMPYGTQPSFDFDSPDVRLMDMDGDGVTDVVSTGTRFSYYLHEPSTSGSPPRWSPQEGTWPTLDAQSPEEFRFRFSSRWIKLGDLNGDGLQDVVHLTEDGLEYWPSLGHGHWGRRVPMPLPRTDGMVWPFDAPERVLLADVDGDGVDDLVLLEQGKITVWINQHGNRWSDPVTLDLLPWYAHVDDVRVADILGVGAKGVLWSHKPAGASTIVYEFLDLTQGVKPYLLTEMTNSMGAITRMQYAPSTQCYLADQADPADPTASAWMTPLPFPVQVVARVEVIDALSGGKLTTEYRYHHGYWDGAEREFRGFGCVEQLDTEVFEAFHGPGLHGATPFEPVAVRSFSPPLLTKTWFHLGPVGDAFAARSEADFSGEYWPGDPSVLPPPAETLQLLRVLPAAARADALRTLRGQVLRTELYALDGTARADRPFTVTEFQYGLREESPPAGGDSPRRRIFFPHPLAQRTTQWERGDEPLTQVTFTDDYDAYGQSRRQVSVAVPRHRDYRTPAPAGAPYLGTLVETQYAQRDDGERYIVDRMSGSTSSEILNDGSPTVFELYRQVQAGTVPRKLFGQTCNYYDGDAFVGLPFGQLGDFGALVRSEALVLTEELLREAYRDPANAGAPDLPPYLRPEGTPHWPAEYPQAFRDETPALAGYTFADGSDHRVRGYFAQASRVAFDFQMQMPGVPHRGLPVAMRDPLGHDTTTAYDRPYHVLPVQITDAVGLTTSAEYDYRVLQPRLIMDVNRNRRAVTFSPLGLVTATAVMGKEGEQVGDTLEAPGSRLEYDFFAFVHRQQPVCVRSIVRQHHVTETDVPLPERDATIETVEYSDGFGRLLQTRTQAEEVVFGDPSFGGDVLSADQASATGDAVGRRRAAGDPPNVVVSGWQVYDNKGRVVEKYEPFFAVGWDYGAPGDTQMGHKVTIFYDPRGQVIRTVNPDGSEQRVLYGIPADLTNPDQFVPTPWEAYTYDANDLAPLSQGPDGASLANAAPPTHRFTPSSIVLDALGRTSEAIARNGTAPADWFRTRSAYDMRGNVLSVTDALNRVAFRHTYDLANRPWRIESIDAGLRRLVLNVLGNETERRDSKGALILQAYDRQQRPIRLWARDDAGSPITLRQRMAYGDAGSPDQAASERAARQATNLLGQLHRHHDEAGLTTVAVVDFKGNVLDKSRRVIADAPILDVFAQAPPHAWQVVPFQVDWEPRPQHTLAERESALLEGTAYQTTASVDALNRLKRLQFPQDVEGKRRELRPAYNRAGGLEQVWLDDTLYVERVAYNAKGQRTLIAYGNGVMTRSAYDPHTFRLKRLRSERYTTPGDLRYHPDGEALQDFGYDYDLVGNILGIRDRTPGSGILNNPEAFTVGDAALAQLLVSGNALNRRFDYDPLYRLLTATGREGDRPPDGPPWAGQPRGTDLTRSRAYTEQYRYDPMGNMLRLEHRNELGGFTRAFTVEAASNRLRRMEIGDVGYDYAFDGNGNMQSETASRHFEWNYRDQMKVFRTQVADAEPSVYVHYLYDATGQRIKKLVRKQGGQVEVTHYIDGVFEHHRWGSGAQAGTHNQVHVMDDQQRITLVRFGPAHPDDRGPAVQLHLGDHLGSSNMVVDSGGTPVNREEFTPYGETSFGSFVRKRYRYTGKERDEETGFTYHGARYYAPWLGRWVSCDPLGLIDGSNLYLYARSNPINYVDLYGTESRSKQDLQAWKRETLAEIASLRADIARLMTSEDMQYLKADALTKQIDAQEALLNLKKAEERAIASAKRAHNASRAVKIIGGTAEMIGGGLACPATGFGCALAAHGADTLIAGVRDKRSGTAYVATETICLGNERCGDYTDAAVGMVLSFGTSQASLINAAGNLAPEATALGTAGKLIWPKVSVASEQAAVVPTKTVGRWMSPSELAKMKQTGLVQEGGGGQTRVADPANPNSYRNAPKGDVYVEFDVPAHRVLLHSEGTGRIPGPRSPDARLPGRNPADFEMPPATNIKTFD
jgi:RHS repeat-associated protein